MACERGKTKVCVIGAGAAGLCAVKQLARDSNFEATVYEQTNSVGGTWVYVEETGSDGNGLPIHSSMYRNLRTNLPARIMNFPDYTAMQVEEPCCVTHQEVLHYLRNYAEHFQLLSHIQFETKVENIRPQTPAGDSREKWVVRTKNLKTQKVKTEVFDAVMICNGHYSDPYVPAIPGIESFPGISLHSHSYRKPEMFSGKTVLILGAAASGVDIAIDLLNHAVGVYLSHNNDRLTGMPASVMQVAGVERVEGNQFFLKDGGSVIAEVFIYCTGYRYTFPFLDESCGICVDSNYVTPLYKHLVNIEHPTMCIVGIPTTVIPFPMFFMQVKYFISILNGHATLPSKPDMLDDSRLKTTKKRHAHRLADQQWDYNDSLAMKGNFERLPLFYKNGYIAWNELRRTNLLNYKNSKFVVCDDEEHVEVVVPS